MSEPERSPSTRLSLAGRWCWRVLVETLSFALVFQGVPLPFITSTAPRPLQLVKQALEPQEAAAWQIKRVIHGSYALSATAEVESIDISGSLGGVPLDMNKSFVISSVSVATTFNPVSDAAVSIDDPTHLLVSRITAGAANLEYQVVEFVSGVSVQSGLTTVSESQLTKNIVLPTSVDTAKSFPIITWRSFRHVSQATHDEKNNFMAQLSASNNLLLTRTENASGYHNDISYQVITFDQDVSVRKGTFNINASVGAGETSDNGTVLTYDFTPVIADLTKAFLLVTVAPGNVGGVESRFAVDGEITDNNTLTFRRAVNSSNVNGTWHLIEFTNNVVTERSRLASALPAATAAYTYNSAVDYDETRVIAFHSASGGSGTNTGDLDDIKVRGKVQQGTGVTSYVLTRATSTTAAVPSVFLGELPPVNLLTPNGSASQVIRVGDTFAVTWEHADGRGTDSRQLHVSLDSGGSYLGTALTCPKTSGAPGTDGTLENLSCDWVVPQSVGGTNIIDDQSRLRLTDSTLSARNTDASNADFKIKGKLEIQVPNGGEVWNIGDTSKSISWKYWGLMGTCTLSYSTNSGGAWTVIDNAVTCGAGADGSTATYLWSPGGTGVPDLPFTTMKIKVEDNDGPAADTFDVSDADFEIRPSIVVEKPTNTNQWPVGRCRTIQWSTTGTVSTVDISYKVGVASYASVVSNNAGYTGNGTNGCEASCANGKKCYDWTLPNGTAQGTTAKLKIQKTGDVNVVDEGPDAGDGYFDIIASIDVVSPSSGTELWKVGTGQNITFDIGGNAGVDKVDVFYAENGSAGSPTWVQIGNDIDVTTCRNNPSPSCAFNWPSVDDAISADVRVRVQDWVDGATVYDASDNSFNIIGGITVSKPNATPPDDIVRIGSAYNIQWTTTGNIKADTCPGGLDCLEIRLATDGTNFSTLLVGSQDSTTGTKTYAWTPGAATALVDTAKVRVGVPSSTTVLGDSLTFKIKANLSAVTPGDAAGQEHTAQNTIPITWTVSPPTLASNVAIKYDLNSGNDGYPNSIACTEGVRQAQHGSCTWPAANTDILDSNVRVKIELVGQEADVFAVSGYDFRIKGALTLTTPSLNGGDPRLTWEAGTPQNIAWTHKGSSLGNLKIYYSKDGGPDNYVTEIDSAVVKASGADLYSWTIPDNVNDGIANPAKNDNIKIKLVSNSFADVTSISAQPITIKGRFISLVPNGGETWYVGDPGVPGDNHNISWTTKGAVTPVDIHYTVNGTDWTALTPLGGISNANGYNWNVDAPVGTTTKVRVQSTNSPADVTVQSVGNFTVKGKLAITNPTAADAGAGALRVAAVENITWTRFGAVGTLAIKYANDGVTFGTTIATGVDSADLTYPWTVPDQIAGGVDNKIQIECEVATKCDPVISDAFEIKGTLDLLNNAGPYGAGSGNIPVQWTYTGTLGNVEIIYDDNSGAGGYPTPGNRVAIIAHNYGSCTQGNTCTYNWPTPLLTGTKFRFKMVQVSDTAVFDTSTQDFAIKGTITLTRPTGTEGVPVVFKVGTDESITWTKTGNLGDVNIKYSRDNGGDNYAATIATVPDSDLAYTWTNIPAAILNSQDKHSQFKVRVEQVTDPGGTFSTSTNPITVTSRLTSLTPNGGETWFSGENRNVSWTTYGAVNTVNVKYSTDGGTTWGGTIASAAANSSPMAWTVSAPVDNDIRVRVESADSVNTGTSNTDVYVASGSNFTVKGKLTITSPTGSNVGAQALRVDDPHNITWTLNGTVGTVAIKYASDGSTYSTTIATGVDSTTLSYSPWAIPDQIPGGADNKIKFECEETLPSSATPKCDPVETNAFEIKGRLALTAPDGGEVYYVGGGTIPIQWNYKGNLGNIELRYDRNSGKGDDNTAGNGDDYANLINTVAHNQGGCAQGATCTYNWTIPTLAGTKYRIRLIQVSDTGIQDSSLADFVVKGNVTLVRPGKNAGAVESWTVDGIANVIEWSVTGGLPTVDLLLDTNGGADGYLTTIQSGVTATASPYTWTIPSGSYVAVTTNAARVRVRDSGDPTVYDSSTNNFKIKPVLTLTFPTPAYKWYVNSNNNIAWAAPKGNIANVKIEYSLDGGSTWVNPAISDSVSAANLQFQWAPPSQAANPDTVIRITKVGDAEVFSTSAQFSIFPTFTNIVPTGTPAVNLPIATTYDIEWTPVGLPGASRLQYSINGGTNWLDIESSPGNPVQIADPVAVTSYTWTIPDNPSPTVKVKIYEVANPTDVLGVSAQNNAIIGSIFMVHPDPATTEELVAEQPYTIEWTKNGTIPSFKIEYHDGTSWNTVIADTGSTAATYNWASVADDIGTNYKFRVSDATNANVYGETATVHTIKGSINLTDPDGAETLTVGTPFDIDWTKTGAIGNIKIEYSKDNFAADTRTIVASYPADSSPYAWTPTIAQILAADMNADILKVRVTSIGGVPVTDQSGSPFKVVGNIFNVQPSGSGTVWLFGGASQNVTWEQTGNIALVDLKYKTSAGSSFNKTIALGVASANGANNYSATVPDENTEDAWVQVVDAGNASVNGASSAAFSIRPNITVSAPTAGQNIQVGSTYPAGVTWSLNGSTKVSTVNVVYNVDGGAYSNTIASGVTATAGSAAWSNVQNHLSGAQAKNLSQVKVVDTGNANVFGLSATFDLLGKIVVDSPSAGNNWQAGSNQNISWTPSGNLGNVKLYYFHDGAYEAISGGTVAHTATPFSWAVPAQVEENATIKIVDLDTEGTADEVAGVSGAFNLTGGFTMSAVPATLNSAAPYSVTWTRVAASEIPTAKLEFYNGSAWINIDAATTNTGLVPNSGSYSWTVPSNVACTSCQFRISDPDNAGPTTAVSNTFEVRAGLAVTAPASGAKWTIGTTGNLIGWTVTGVISQVKLEYSRNGGASYTSPDGLTIATVAANTSPYDWTIPTNQDILTPNQARIRVSDASLAVVYAESPTFMMKGGLTVARPNTNDILKVGDAFSIEWTTVGTANMGNVVLKFSKTGGAPWTTVDTVAFGSSPYTLWAPGNGDITSNAKAAKVRIEDEDNAAEVFDDSDAFEIEGKVALNAPNTSGLKWPISTSQDIKWTPTGTYSNVQLHYAKNYTVDGFTNAVLIATATNSASGTQATYPWTVPAEAQDDDLRIRVRDDLDPNVSDFSDFSLKVLPLLTVLAPQSGEVWLKGDTNRVIQWTTGTSVVPAVKIEYKTSVGGAWTTIVASDGGHSSAGTNSYTWPSVADEKTETAYVQVSDVAHPTDVFDEGNAPFAIRPKITVTAPAADANIVVGSTNTNAVQWSINGTSTVSHVDVLYSTDGGAFDKTIATGVLASAGQVNWNGVADTLSGNAVAKVVDATAGTANANVFGLSPSFDIIGKIVVDNPAAAANWQAGSTDKTITWTPSGTLGSVKIYYFHDGAYELIGTVPHTPSSFAWNPVPGQVEENSTVKIVDADTEGTADEVNGISGAFNLTGGFSFAAVPATLNAGGNYTITWTRIAASEIPTAKLEYLSDAGWRNIDFGGTDTGLVSNTGSYNWSVPTDTSCTTCMFRISDPDNFTPTVTVSNTFEVRAGLQVTAPTGAAKWTIGTGGNTISWSITGVVTQVSIDYSSDNGSSYPVHIATVASSPATYAWTIPTNLDILTPNQAMIKVSDASLAVVYDESPAFMMKSGITVTSPASGNVPVVGTAFNIAWTTLGTANMGQVSLKFSKTGAAPWTTITGTAAFNSSPYTLWAPATGDVTSGAVAKVRIEDNDNAAEVFDESDAFAVKGSVAITAPSGAAVWTAGATHNILWNATGDIGNVDLAYSVNDGAYQTIATDVPSPLASGNSYGWLLPTDSIVSADVKIRIQGANVVTPAISPAFSVKGNISLSYPDAAGIVTSLGDQLTVTWTRAGDIGPVKVEYFDGSDWATLTTTAPQNGPYAFTLDNPTTTLATSAAKVRVTDADNAAVTDESANTFTVRPLLAVTAPAGNEAFVVGTTTNITWTRKGSNVVDVKLEYSKDSGSNYNDVIVNPTENDGTYTWTIPDDIRAVKDMKVRISSLPTSATYATTGVSAGLFQIVGALQMAVPNDATGVKWRVGSTGNELRWNATGSIINVKLEYSTNGGTDWLTAVASAPSGAGTNKSATWNIPNNAVIAKDTVRFKVLDAANTNVFDTADANSSLLANFTITAPVNPNVWVAETSNDVTWTTPVPGTPANVKLEYDLNDGSGWQTLVANTTNSGTRSWSLGTTLSQSARVRISDVNDADSVLTGTPFKIQGELVLTSPNAGTESWEIDTVHPITWTKKGAITAVKLQLTTDADAGTPVYTALVDGDAQDTQNISVTGAGPYTFNWKIPDLAGITTTKARVRVVDANDAAVLDGSNANFTIKGRVDLATPNGGQTLTVGVPYAVTGSVFGPITSVKMFYSTNGGSTYPNSVENCATVPVVTGSFSCNWAVPDQLGANIKVRVEDAANALVFDESATTLAIKGSATITAPVSGNIWFAGDVHNIVWDRTGTIGNVDLTYSVNNGAYQSIAGGVASPLATGNTFGWTLPTSSIVTANLKIKIDGVNLVAPAISPAITVKGKVTLDYPDAAGITMTLGDSLNVQWTAAGDIGPVKVEYFDGAAWGTVTTTAPQNGPYAFTLDTPTTTIATVNARVRVSDADDATVIDTSANAFTVRPLLAITSPTGGDTWLVNSVHPITWNRKGSNVTNVKLEYSNNNFSTSTTLFSGTTPNDGTENWTVPDDIQSVPNLKMKISSLPLADPYAVTATSNGLFQIVGGLTVTQPSDSTGVKWRVGSTGNEIKWDAVGSVAFVKIDYSTNSGGSWLPVTASAASGAGANKSFSWNIPASAALAKDTVRIRVADAADTNIFDIGTANSSLLANFAFTAPTTGQVWVAETSNDITWNNLGSGAGSPTDVKLEYNLGASWQLITNSTLNSGSYSWLLGTGLSTAAKVRIQDVADTDSLIESQTFKIRGDLAMTAPNTGLESWEIGTVHPITWTKKGAISTVKLQFSNNGDNPVDYTALVDGDGANTQTINVSGAGPYSFNWKIPDIAGMTTTLARIRVVDASDSTVYDPSNANFTIKGRVDLLNPDGGQTLTVGVPYTVTGNVFGPIGSVKLFYSTNGTTYDFAMENCNTVAVVGGTFSCDWSVPDRISTTVKVKVEDATNSLVSDTSTANLAIKGTAAITAPTVSSVWIAGDAHDIVWNRNGTIGNVDLLYSVNNGSFQTIASNVASPSLSGNTFSWTLPSTGIVSSNVKVRISGANLVANVDSPSFTVKGKLTLQYPDAAGIVLTLGDTANVSWLVAGDIGPVKVEYYNGTAWSTLTTTAPQAGPFGLLLDAPNTTVATTGAKVRISDPDDATVTDESANGFTVRPLLALTAPSGNEAWVVNSFHDVLWNFKGSNVTSVRLEYSNDGGSTFNGVISSGTPNDGTHSWQIPDEIQAVPNMKVRILSLPTSDPFAVTAVSSGLFKITGALTVTSPQAPDKWLVGSTRDIKWARTGSIANVRITYSTNGTDYNSIVDTYPGGNGDTGYPWTIPNVAGIVSSTATVRIADVLDSSVNHVSPQFKIVPSFTVTAPAANDRLLASRQTTVTWDRLGQNPTVNLYYSKDGFSGAGISIAAAVNNTGSYTWNVPDDLSNTVTLRVTYPADETVFDDSGVFKVVPGFTMVAPNAAADKWDVASNQTIRWTSTSANAPTVRLDYSTDGGATYPFQITSTTSNAGAVDAERTFAWNNLPDTITDQFKVKVSSTSDALAMDTSDFSGKIKAFFDVLTPSAPGVVLTVGQPYDITWDWNGTVPNVRLDYSKNDFAAATNIAISDPNDGVFEWTVPDDISATVKIRVRSVTDVDAFDISNTAFKIQGAFQVVDPNGGNNFDIGFSHNLRWNTTGNIGTVNVVAYSTLPGDTGFPHPVGAPLTVAAGLANTGNGQTTFAWNPVPDKASPNVRVRVIDANDATVFDDSDANFRIRGSFTVTSPNGGETFTINSVQTVGWNPTGASITQALLRYSTVSAAGPWTPVAETEGTPNDGIIANDGSFDWTVPDAPSPTVWMRVEDPNDATVFDVSNASFRIRVGFVFITPSGGERWVTNEMRTVSWNTTGSTTTVNLLYSTNNFTTSTVVANGLANVTGLNSYGWEIPNTLSNTAKLRLVDANDTTVTADSNAFTLDHYQITFEIRDLLTNNHLDVLAVNATENTGVAHAWDSWVTSGLNSPFTQGLPAGAWTATFSRNEYGDQAVNFVADQDQTVTVFMETEVVHIWEAITDLAYNTNNDSVAIATTLRRDGSTVPGAISCAVKFYDAGALIQQFTQAGGPDAQGFYNFTWSAPTGLVGGKVYNVVTTIGIATGGVFNTPRTFTITTEKKLQDVQDFVAQQLDVSLSEVGDDIQVKLDAQTDQLQATLDGQTGLIQNKLDEFSGQVASSIISLEDAADRSQTATENLEQAAAQSLTAAGELEAVGKKFAGRLLIPTTVLMGETTILRYRGGAGLVPLIDVFGFNQDDEQVYMAEAQPMPESPDEPGLYTYEIAVTESNGFVSGGPFTVFVQEPVTGNFEAGSVYVQSVSLDSIQGMMAADSGAKKIAQEALDLLNGIEGQLGGDGELGQALEALKAKVERIPKAITEDSDAVKMRDTISAISESITNLAGDEGYDFSELVKKGLEESPTITDIREKTDEVQGATEVMQILMENKLGGVDDPVVHVTFQ